MRKLKIFLKNSHINYHDIQRRPFFKPGLCNFLVILLRNQKKHFSLPSLCVSFFLEGKTALVYMSWDSKKGFLVKIENQENHQTQDSTFSCYLESR